MSYTARQLITRAYYLSGIVSRQLQTVAGDQITNGFELLNDMMAFKSAHQRLIPYYKEYAFNAVTGQEKYNIPNLVLAETLTFNIGPVRYSMRDTSRKKYFGTARVDNIESLPFNWHIERTFGGADLYIYFIPNTNYPLKLWGKFGFDEIATVDDDLSLLYDKFYLTYMRYALAEYICEDSRITFSAQSAAHLKEFERALTDISPMDLTMDKLSTLRRRYSLSYADVNIGRGWRP